MFEPSVKVRAASTANFFTVLSSTAVNVVNGKKLAGILAAASTLATICIQYFLSKTAVLGLMTFINMFLSIRRQTAIIFPRIGTLLLRVIFIQLNSVTRQTQSFSFMRFGTVALRANKFLIFILPIFWNHNSRHYPTFSLASINSATLNGAEHITFSNFTGFPVGFFATLRTNNIFTLAFPLWYIPIEHKNTVHLSDFAIPSQIAKPVMDGLIAL
mgnify:CR=1 FL=1